MREITWKKKSAQLINNESLADKVYNLLETDILDTELAPGSNLNEDEIAAVFNVSRSPVREALLRLEHAGLVTKDKKGRVVACITEEIIADNYQIWEMVEAFAAGLGCLNATADDFGKIERILAEMELKKNEATIKQYRELNYTFHTQLVAPCPNHVIVELHKNALAHIRWCYNYSITLTKDVDYSNLHHHEIFKAYKNKDKLIVENAIRQHIGNAFKRLTRYEKKGE